MRYTSASLDQIGVISWSSDFNVKMRCERVDGWMDELMLATFRFFKISQAQGHARTTGA